MVEAPPREAEALQTDKPAVTFAALDQPQVLDADPLPRLMDDGDP